jgi:hypothetical protein
MSDLKTKWIKMNEENEKLWNILNKVVDYIDHDSECERVNFSNRKCNCGYEDLKKEIKELEGEK